MLKTGYVATMRVVRRGAARTGVLRHFERSDGPVVRHLRTMLAIHDVRELSTLDLPWWTYRAIDEVAAFLAARPHARVFEYGSGASTVYLARRAGCVHSVEHDVGFAEVVRGMIGGMEHVRLHTVSPASAVAATPRIGSQRAGHRRLDFTDYVRSIDDVGGSFDLVVIDGRARAACLARAREHLADDGVILFDDAGRRRYRPALRAATMRIQVYRGLRPCLFYPTSTALLRRDGVAR